MIDEMKTIGSIQKLQGVKKLAGHKSAYRYRIGNYRVGFFLENNSIILNRILHRKDIYKVFP